MTTSATAPTGSQTAGPAPAAPTGDRAAAGPVPAAPTGARAVLGPDAALPAASAAEVAPVAPAAGAPAAEAPAAEAPAAGASTAVPAAEVAVAAPAGVLAERTGASQTPGSLRGEGEVCEAGGEARSGALRRVLVVGVAVAAVVALVLGVLWVLALTSGSLALARDRDAVLVDGRQAAINLNTLDYRNVDAGLDLWQQSSTGSVLAEFQQNRDQYAKLVRESKRTTVATVPDAAVTELDERAGVARVLVAVDVTVTPDGQPPAVTRQRLQMEMTRTPDGWKVGKLSPVRTPSTGAGN